MDDITASIIVSCQTSKAAASIDKLGFSLTMLGRKALNFGISAVNEFRATQDAAWKFGKVFANSMGSADTVVKEFMSSYNLSRQTAMSMLGDTASVLKGAGMGEKAALKMSERVVKMGVDLASFTGYAGGAKGATEAITAAMLGETDRMKALGTVIRMDSDEFKNMTNKIMKTEGVTESLAKMMATLELIYKKNQDAIGDYMADGENFTQNINIWKENLKEATSNIGALLYEIFNLNTGVGGVGEKLKEVNAWWQTEGAKITYNARIFFIDLVTMGELAVATIKPAFQIIALSIKNLVKVGQWFFVNWSNIWDNSGNIALAVFQDIWEYIKWFWGPDGMITGFFITAGKAIWKALKAGLTGGDVAKAFSEEWSKYVDKNVVGGFAKQGRNTEKALAAAGTTPFPELQLPEFDVSGDWARIMADNDKKTKAAGERYFRSLAAKKDKKTNDDALVNSAITEAQRKALTSFYKDINKYRATTQGAIYSGSVEAMRLQSRSVIGTSANPAEATAKNTEKQVKLNEDIARMMNDMIIKMNTITTGGIKLNNAIKTL